MKRLYTDDNIDELIDEIDAYFAVCEEEEEKPCFSGLAYGLGFCERRSLNDYAGHKDKTSTPIKRAMLKIEWSYEKGLSSQSCTGSIFALKNRGWTDKQEIEHSGGIAYLPAQAEKEGM